MGQKEHKEGLKIDQQGAPGGIGFAESEIEQGKLEGKQDGHDKKLTGLSPTDIEIANFIGQLSASPLFEDVNMGYARTEEFDGRVGRKFQASCLVAR